MKELPTHEVSSKRSTERRIHETLIVVAVDIFTNLYQIKFYFSKPNYTYRTLTQTISDRLCIQSSLWFFARCYKPPSYLQMWPVCDCSAGGEEIVPNFEFWGETLQEGSATCSVSCSVSTVRTVNWSTDEDTLATEGEGVTSAVYHHPPSASVAIMASVFSGRRIVHRG